MTIQTISAEQYAIECAICDKAAEYAERVMCEGGDKRKRNYLTAEEMQHPDYAACSNDMRGRVEQFELLRDAPEVIFAYVGRPKGNGMDCDRQVGQSYPITVWTGHVIGTATRGAARRQGYATFNQYYARIAGREYTGRGAGPGMWIRLKETAASKKNNPR